ncbi:MAG: YfhO family protein [Spirochaetia bacterium]|nr:YfhO family protein [Spirochaetia bacterium]
MVQIRKFAKFKYAPVALLLIGALFLLTRSNLKGLDQSYIFSDIVTYEYPMQRYFHDRIMKGELPLWNPYASSGNPVIGTLQARLLYPPHLILTVLLGLEWGQFVEILFHFFLGMFGSYLMLRSFRFRFTGASAGALLFVFSTEFLGTFKLMNLLACLAWLPVCIYTIRNFTKAPNVSHAVCMSLAFTMLLYGGYPQYAFFAAHACGLVFVYSLIENRRNLIHKKLTTASYLMLAIGLFAILTAPQLIAASEFFRLGLRGEVGVTLDQFNRVGGRPVSGIFPDLLGGNSATKLIVPGLILLGLGSGLWGKRNRFLVIAMLCLAIPFAILSMGSKAPLAEWYFNHYPLGSAFRIPERSIHILLIPCAIGIALFIQNVSRFIRRFRILGISMQIKSALLVLTVILVLLPQKSLVAIAFIHVSQFIDGYGQSIARSIPEQSDFRFDSTCNPFFAPCEKSGMLSARRSLSDYEPSNTYRSFLLSSILSEDIRNRSSGTIWLGETHLDYKSLGDITALRLLGVSSVKWIVGNRGLWLRADRATQQKVQDHFRMNPESIQSPAIANFVAKTLGPTAQMAMGDQLDQYVLFEMKGPVLPRAYLTNRIFPTLTARESSVALNGQINPMDQTIIELPGDQAKLKDIDPSDHLTSAIFLRDEPEHVTLETKAAGETFLVLNDKFFPDWECTIDGQRSTILPANLLFRAVRVPAGTHQIEFRYIPRTFMIAGYASCLALLLAILLLAISLKRERNRINEKKVA